MGKKKEDKQMTRKELAGILMSLGLGSAVGCMMYRLRIGYPLFPGIDSRMENLLGGEGVDVAGSFIVGGALESPSGGTKQALVEYGGAGSMSNIARKLGTKTLREHFWEGIWGMEGTPYEELTGVDWD